jgi:hypothetical protein
MMVFAKLRNGMEHWIIPIRIQMPARAVGKSERSGCRLGSFISASSILI